MGVRMDRVTDFLEGKEERRGKEDRKPSCSFRVPEHVRTTHGADGGVVLDILHGQMFYLNPSASLTLQLLKRGLSQPEISELLASEFGIGRATAEADALEFVETLKGHHLLVPSPTSE